MEQLTLEGIHTRLTKVEQDIAHIYQEQRNTAGQSINQKPKVSIYADGSAISNPNGPGGYGTIVVYEDAKRKHTKEYSGGFKKSTNNRMEIMGVIIGMETLDRPCEVSVYSDSQYLVNTFEKGWIDKWMKNNWKRSPSGGKPVKNVDLWKRLLQAIKPHNVRFHWVKGHDGHPENERCDTLAKQAARSKKLQIDKF